MPKEEIAYSCSICGTRYLSKEMAEKCEKRGRYIEKFESKCKPWHWYRLTCSAFKNGETKDIVAYKVNKYGRYGENTCCLDYNIELDKYSSNDGYLVPENWQIVEILSITEMYEKYEKIFDPYYHGWDGALRDMKRGGMPEEIAMEINETFKLFREKRAKELMDKYNNDPSQIANYAAGLETPQLNIIYPQEGN